LRADAPSQKVKEEDVRRLLSMIMLLLAAGTLSPAATAFAADHPTGPRSQRFGVRLVDIPVAEASNPRALRYIVDYLPTGTVIHRRIMIMNQGAKTAHFTVYADAAQISNGLFTGEAGATRNELTGWISVQHRAPTLGPNASELDMITIKVPKGATRGEHYAVIWVQQAAVVRASNGFLVNDVVRVGIRVYLAVGRGGAPPTNFAITSVTAQRSASGQPTLIAHVDNTGGRAVDLNGTVRLTGGPGNTSAGPFPARAIVTLAPGQSGNMTFTPPKSLPNGPWQVQVSLVSGITTSTATATVKFGAVVPSRTGLSLTAWLGLSLGVLVIAMIPVVLALRRRRATARHSRAG
jgi:hypothetical protein